MQNSSLPRDSKRLKYTRHHLRCRCLPWSLRKIENVAGIAAQTTQFCPQGDQEVYCEKGLLKGVIAKKLSKIEKSKKGIRDK